MTRPRRHRRHPAPPSPAIARYPTTEEDEEDLDDPSLSDPRQCVSDDGDVADDEEGQTPATGSDASYSECRSSCPPPRGRTVPSASDSWSSPTELSAPTFARGTTPPTYVNVAPLPVFRGGPGECPVAHLRRFARVCRANNAPSAAAMARIFPVTLDGGAALWYELEVETRPDLSWEAVQSSFLRAYCGPELVEQSRSELMAMKQGVGETVNAYYLRMQWVLRKWPGHGIPNAMLRGIFVDGLREDCQDWIAPQRPETLEEAFRLALSWEQAQIARAARRRNAGADPALPADGVSKCGFCNGQHEEGSCEVRQRMRELWLRSRERPQAKTAALPSGGSESGSPSHGNFRSLSLSASMVRQPGEGGKEGVGRLGFRRSQCQCLMHQCWKKYERSNSSLAEGNSPSAD